MLTGVSASTGTKRSGSMASPNFFLTAAIVPLVAKIGIFVFFAIIGRPWMWSVCSWVRKMPSRSSRLMSRSARASIVRFLEMPQSTRIRHASDPTRMQFPEEPDAKL